MSVQRRIKQQGPVEPAVLFYLEQRGNTVALKMSVGDGLDNTVLVIGEDGRLRRSDGVHRTKYHGAVALDE